MSVSGCGKKEGEGKWRWKSDYVKKAGEKCFPFNGMVVVGLTDAMRPFALLLHPPTNQY
jgi:hypothetical protein